MVDLASPLPAVDRAAAGVAILAAQ